MFCVRHDNSIRDILLTLDATVP